MKRLLQIFDRHVFPYLRTDKALRTQIRSFPKSINELVSRMPITLTYAVMISVLEFTRHRSAAVASIYELGAFRTSDLWSYGILLSGFFHEGPGHFSANLIGVFLISGTLEAATSSRVLAVTLLLGMILANPLTVILLKPILSITDPMALAHFMSEKDYGASNGLFAGVGALSAFLVRPKILIGPFLFNAFLYAIASSSWLASQHFLAMGLGYFYGLWRSRQGVGISVKSPISKL